MRKTNIRRALRTGTIITMVGFFISGAPASPLSVPSAQAAVSDWQKGATLRLTNEPKEQVRASLEQLARTGANFVAITPGYLTDSETSTNVDRKERTPSDEILIYTIEQAHALGMQVMLKPHLDIKNGRWRVHIKPTDRDTFFGNYASMILHYASMSERYKVELLSVGSELYGLSTDTKNEPYWRKLIADVRSTYHGEVTYNGIANGPYYDESTLPFWDALDYWGLSLYPSLGDDAHPTVASITEKWKQFDKEYIQPRKAKIGLPMLITEMGYRSVDGGCMEPGDYVAGSTADMQEQADLYTAFFEFWKDRSDLMGVHLWDWKPDVNAGGSQDTDYTVQNKPAAAIMEKYFTMSGPTEIAEPVVSDPAPTSGVVEIDALFSDVTVKNGGIYEVSTMHKDADFYVDRDYTVVDLPKALDGLTYIRPRNDDKWYKENDLLSFMLEGDATLYVAFDSRAGSLPSWLSSWERIDMTIGTTDVSFNVYSKAFSKGKVTLGGNAVSPMSGAESTYLVLGNIVSASNAPTAPAATFVSQSASIIGDLRLQEPREGEHMSGVRKLKVYIDGIDPNEYVVTYNVDGRGEMPMNYRTYQNLQQAKIDFSEWTWNGDGPYHLVVTAKDKNGAVIDAAERTVYVSN